MGGMVAVEICTLLYPMSDSTFMLVWRVHSAEAVPSNLPLVTDLLHYKQLLVGLLAGLASGVELLGTAGRRSGEGVLV